MMLEGDIKLLGNSIKLESVELRKQQSAEAHGINDSRVIGKPETLCIFAYKSGIEGGIVSDYHCISAPLKKLRQHYFYRIGIHDHGIVDGGELCDTERNRHTGIYENVHAVNDLVVVKLYRTDLDNVVGLGTETGGLDIENHSVMEKLLAFIIDNYGLLIIHQVSFASVNYLEIFVTAYLFQINACIREGLDHTMICDGHGIHTEGNGGVDIIAYI